MFEELNKHKNLDILEIGETAEWSFRLVIAEAGIVENSPEVTSVEEPNDKIRELLNESKPIEVTESSKHYEIVFSEYITYSVTNESYANAGETEIYEGKLARIYSKSAFIDYIAHNTIATSDYPGPFKHYRFCCLNHIIDVASVEPPMVKVIYSTPSYRQRYARFLKIDFPR